MNRTKRFLMILAVLMITATMVFAGGGQEATPGAQAAPAQRVELLGAGASFPAPLITAWADDYQDLTNGRVTVNYQSIGSGGGIRQFIEQTIMFGATEAALNDQQAADIVQATGGVGYNLPITLGDVVLTYNLPGVESGLVFSADTIAGAFLGQITRWNDPAIQELNPGVSLPNLPIQIAHRSDGSGTTNIFTNYLTKVSTEWADRVGFGSSVNWPTGTGGNGNEGVAAIVQSTPGALGYNSLVYAVLEDISYGSVINNSGNTIVPSLQATSLAADVPVPSDGRVMLTDTDAPQGYPIAGFAWALVHENLDQNSAISTRAQAEELVRFIYYMATEGQNLNESLSFARLPDAAQSLAIEMISSLTWQGQVIGAEIIADVNANGF